MLFESGAEVGNVLGVVSLVVQQVRSGIRDHFDVFSSGGLQLTALLLGEGALV